MIHSEIYWQRIKHISAAWNEFVYDNNIIYNIMVGYDTEWRLHDMNQNGYFPILAMQCNSYTYTIKKNKYLRFPKCFCQTNVNVSEFIIMFYVQMLNKN